MARTKRTCFGFFTGDDSCQKCAAAKKCKAILVTNGFDVAAGVLEEILATLPEGTYEIDLDEIHVDLVPGADDDLKKRARAEAAGVYKQIVLGGKLEPDATGNVATSAIDPSSL